MTDVETPEWFDARYLATKCVARWSAFPIEPYGLDFAEGLAALRASAFTGVG